MDWVLIEQPDFKAAKDLRDAKLKRQGAVFTYENLRKLVEFSQNEVKFDTKCKSDVKAGFKQLLGRAAKALSTKTSFALTASEVEMWYQFFERIQEWRVEAASAYLHADVVGMYIFPPDSKAAENLMASAAMTTAIFTSWKALISKFEAQGRLRQGIHLDFSDVACLHGLFLMIDREMKAPFDKIKDPTHPLVTAIETISRAAKSKKPVKVYLDSEEVLNIDKLLARLNKLEAQKTYTDAAKEQSEPKVSSGKKQDLTLKPVAFPADNRQTSDRRSQPLAPKDDNKSVKVPSRTTTAHASNPQSTKDQPQSINLKSRNETSSVDDKLKAMVTKYLPSIVPSVLKAERSLLITRWLVPIEASLKNLDDKANMSQEEAEKLRMMMLDIEHGYEEELEEKRDAYTELEEETQEKIKKLESELNAANDQLSKKGSMDEKKCEELLQAERDLYSKLKKETEEKVAKLESQLQTANGKIEKAKTNVLKREGQWTTKLQTSTNEVAMWKDKFNAEIARHDVLKLDYEATLEELARLKAEQSKIAERDARCSALENELAVLRSNRTNPQVEKDNIAKAVRNATADKQAELEQIQASIGKVQAELQDKQAALAEQTQQLEQCEARFKEKDAKKQVDMVKLQTELQEQQKELAKQIQRADQCQSAVIQKQAALNKQLQLSEQCKASVKEKDAKIAELQESLAAKNELQIKTLAALKETRRHTSADPTIVRALDEERMTCTYLKDQMTSAADALQALALQLRTEAGL